MNLGVPRCSVTELYGRWCLPLLKKKKIYKTLFDQWFYQGFSDSSVGKESVCNAGDPGLIPGLGRSPGEGTGYLLQYSWASLVAQLVKNLPAMWETWVWSLGWEDALEKEKWDYHPLQYSGLENSRVTKSQTWLSNFHFSLYHLTSSTAVYESYSCPTFPPIEEGWSVLNILVSSMLELACSSLWEPIIGISYQLWVYWHLVGSLKLFAVGIFTP